MPRSAPRGGPGLLSAPLRFQVLRVAVEITCNSARMAEKARRLANSAQQEETVRRTVRYAIVRDEDGAYAVSRDARPFDVQFDPFGVLRVLRRQIECDALAAYGEGIAVPAVTGRHRGRRFLLVGETPRLRSTLAGALHAAGVVIEGDDLAIVHAGAVTAYPRWIGDLDGPRAGWRITSGRPDHVIVLEANLGGHSRIDRVPAQEMARILISWSRSLADPVDTVRAAARLTQGASCHRLWLGSPDDLPSVWPVELPDSLSPT